MPFIVKQKVNAALQKIHDIVTKATPIRTEYCYGAVKSL